MQAAFQVAAIGRRGPQRLLVGLAGRTGGRLLIGSCVCIAARYLCPDPTWYIYGGVALRTGRGPLTYQ